MIYVDNAATTKLDADALEAMQPYLQNQFANASQPYSFARVSKTALKEARNTIAVSINANPEEIYFTSGGTESDNWVIKGCMKYGDHRAVITSEFEHHAILHACSRVESLGYPILYLRPNDKGFITAENLMMIISEKTKLVSVMMANNEIGTIQPIAELCEVAHRFGAVFHTDAVQAIGHIPVDVKTLGIDMLSASAHKFNGPKGIGFLYIKSGTQMYAYADGGAQENGMRAGTENIASIVGMAVALKKNIENLDSQTKHLHQLEDTLLYVLTESGVDFVRNGAVPQLPGNMSLSFRDANGEMLLHRLDLMGIMVSTGSACDSKNTRISHVLQAIDIDERYGLGTIRISFGKNNTIEEAERIATAIVKILTRK